MKAPSNIPEDFIPRYEAVGELISAFCADHLDAEYEALCFRALRKLCRMQLLATGRDNMWAAGIVYAILQNCAVVGNDRYVFFSRPKYKLAAQDLSTAFGVSKGGMSERAKWIREALKITRKNEWLTQDLQDARKTMAQFDRLMRGVGK